MEHPQHNEEGAGVGVGGGKNNNTGGGGGGGGGFMCRQSSSRWTPTSEQIRILKELYYNNGVRSPTAEQIQRISARLRQYGKIEGKNVFYWFQNHKARERQKKRLISSSSTPTDHHHHHLHNNNLQYINHQLHHTTTPPNNNWRSSSHRYPAFNINPGVSSSSSSAGVLAVCQIGSYGYGSVAMEKSFRDCSISPRDDYTGGAPTGPNFGWVGMDPYSSIPYPFLDTKKQAALVTLEDEEETAAEIETLPLFPMHGEDGSGKPESDGYYCGGWYCPSTEDGAASRASLELSLNSYMTGRSTGSH